jgi:hypothetical protein
MRGILIIEKTGMKNASFYKTPVVYDSGRVASQLEFLCFGLFVAHIAGVFVGGVSR